MSPERYFLELAFNQAETSTTEKLGIVLGLDLNLMYRILAEFYLERKNSSRVMKYLQLAKVERNY